MVDSTQDEQPKRTVGKPRPSEDLLQRLEDLNALVNLLAPATRPKETGVPRDNANFVRKTVGRPRSR